MNKILYSLLLCLLSLAIVKAFDNGLNMPYNNCGNDFGVSFNVDLFNSSLTRYAAAGANMVRIFIHFDGD